MALSILNNISSLMAQNQLSITGSGLQKTLQRLSSGSKINSGADDAAGLAIANGMSANIAALTQSAQNATASTGKLQTADGALSQVTALLNRAVTLATEASNGTIAAGQSAALDTEFQSILNEINSIGSNTTFNGSAIFKGGSANYNQFQLTPTAPAGLATAVSGTLAIKDTGGSTIMTTSASDATVGDVINDINNKGVGLAASLDTSGNLVITDTQNRSVKGLAGDVAGSDALTADFTTGTFHIAGAAPGAEVGGDLATTTASGNTSNASTFSTYLSDSTTTGSSSISVTLTTLTASGLGLTGNLLNQNAAQSALSAVNVAVSEVSALRGNLGAAMNRLTAATNVMNNQVQNLSNAQDGITAADIGQEVANMTKFNVLQQTGIAALQQANQAQQSVLKLLQ